MNLDLFDIIKKAPHIFEDSYLETTINMYKGLISGQVYYDYSTKNVQFIKINTKYKNIFDNQVKHLNELKRINRTNLNIYYKHDFHLIDSISELEKSIETLKLVPDFYEIKL